ncbi:hypothetical protein [Shewanella sp. SM21]|uniref:hypothetical protein n=1 Tax=Shewanella sp. SM21 TaxID=2912793 RepID=UPI0021D969B7|nr:hypothetical protein [Shewanella sp. SM21]MCU8088378.1 hypothetical protein [Shewanella sp. SM21]
MHNSFGINGQHRDHRTSPPLGVAAGHLRSLRERGMVVKDGTGTSLWGLTVNIEATEVHPPLRSCRGALE